jgi:hypothetical protein
MDTQLTIRPAAPAPDDLGPVFDAALARRHLALALLVAAYVALLLGIGLRRSYIGYHETDYIQFFVPDAERFLAGEPPQGAFHPPLYPILIAATYALLGDWVATGVCCYLLLLRLGGLGRGAHAHGVLHLRGRGGAGVRGRSSAATSVRRRSDRDR